MQRFLLKVVRHYGPNRARLYRCRTCQFEVNRKTVERILENAAAHCHQVSETLRKNDHLTEWQSDERWSFVKKRK